MSAVARLSAARWQRLEEIGNGWPRGVPPPDFDCVSAITEVNFVVVSETRTSTARSIAPRPVIPHARSRPSSQGTRARPSRSRRVGVPLRASLDSRGFPPSNFSSGTMPIIIGAERRLTPPSASRSGAAPCVRTLTRVIAVPPRDDVDAEFCRPPGPPSVFSSLRLRQQDVGHGPRLCRRLPLGARAAPLSSRRTTAFPARASAPARKLLPIRAAIFSPPTPSRKAVEALESALIVRYSPPPAAAGWQLEDEPRRPRGGRDPRRPRPPPPRRTAPRPCNPATSSAAPAPSVSALPPIAEILRGSGHPTVPKRLSRAAGAYTGGVPELHGQVRGMRLRPRRPAASVASSSARRMSSAGPKTRAILDAGLLLRPTPGYCPRCNTTRVSCTRATRQQLAGILAASTTRTKWRVETSSSRTNPCGPSARGSPRPPPSRSLLRAPPLGGSIYFTTAVAAGRIQYGGSDACHVGRTHAVPRRRRWRTAVTTAAALRRALACVGTGTAPHPPRSTHAGHSTGR